MAKYTVNMADQLMKVRTNTQEKLRKEAEVVVEVEKPSALQTAAASHLSKKDEHPLSQNLNEETINENSLADVTKRLKAKKIGVKTITRTKDKVTHLYVHVNDVDDAQKILKNDPLYVAGKLRVVAKEETLHEKTTKTFGVDFEVDAPDEKPVKTGREPHVKTINKLVKKHKLRDFHADDLSKFNVKDDVGGKNITKFFADMIRAGLKVINKKITDNYTSKFMGESNLNEDVKNALAGFDNRVRDAASMDRKDLIKAKELYKRKDVKGLRKHIYSLDTSPLETVMNLISIQDRPFFDKMYPNTRGGEFLARIAYQHRHLDENIDENKDDEKKRMKGAKLKLKMGDEVIKEDGHTDVPSAVRQCKTIVEDATQMMGKLQSMNGEESLPTWWTNKLAVASNSMNKMRDYLLVPSMQEGLNEREKGIDKLPRQFLNPDKEVMVMKKNKVIVIDKKDQDRYTKQGWALAEVLDKEDEPKVKEIVKKLKGASDAHAGQAKDLEKAVNEWFKSKNTDVKVRKLDESIQVYVPLGRRIPNEIREELITIQYGKMPEDVKNIKDISYGNFKENSITMNNDFWNKVLHGTKGE